MLEKIKEICARRGMTIHELEVKAGLGNGTVGSWDVSIPTIRTLKAVAEVLGVSVGELVEEKR